MGVRRLAVPRGGIVVAGGRARRHAGVRQG